MEEEVRRVRTAARGQRGDSAGTGRAGAALRRRQQQRPLSWVDKAEQRQAEPCPSPEPCRRPTLQRRPWRTFSGCAGWAAPSSSSSEDASCRVGRGGAGGRERRRGVRGALRQEKEKRAERDPKDEGRAQRRRRSYDKVQCTLQRPMNTAQ